MGRRAPFIPRESQPHYDAKALVQDRCPLVYVEYPLTTDSIHHGFGVDMKCPPTYDECRNTGTSPFAICDVVVCDDDGIPRVGIEVCLTSPVTTTKLRRFQKQSFPKGFVLLEYDATDILECGSIPDAPKNLWRFNDDDEDGLITDILQSLSHDDTTVCFQSQRIFPRRRFRLRRRRKRHHRRRHHST